MRKMIKCDELPQVMEPTNWYQVKDKIYAMIEISKKKVVKCEIRYMELGYGYSGEHGRSTCYIKCPFCDNEIMIYIWSFNGCGKNCPCGAKLSVFAAWKPV